MNTAYVLAGSNIGNRLQFLREAANEMEEHCGNIVARSHVYETAAWGFTAQPHFYNQAFAISTLLLPAQLMQTLLNIEKKMGRERTITMGPRTLDLDILLIDELSIKTNLLTVPHPRLAQRRFALLPLAEIGGNVIHPILQKTINQLLDECEDDLEVEKLD